MDKNQLGALRAGQEESNNVVHVTVPAAVAFDLESMNKVARDVVARLGCDNCHSGWDIRFRTARQFVVNEKLDVTFATPIEIP